MPEPLRIMLFTTPLGLRAGNVVRPRFGIQPLGVLYLAAALEKWADFKYEIEIVDAYTLGIDADGVRQAIQRFDPHVVGVSAVTILVYDAQHVLKIAKEESPGCVTVIGGPHASCLPEDPAADEFTDVAVIGEGERIFLELCGRIAAGRTYDDIAGIAFKKNGAVRVNPKGPAIMGLDDIPFPNLGLLPPLNQYNPMPHWGRTKKFSTVITSRGCPYNCSYCSVTLDQGVKYRFRSPENIMAELRYLRDSYGVSQVSFRDGTFTANKKRVVDLCNMMLAENLGMEWNCNVRANELDPDMLKLMRKAGCNFIFFGVEQGNEDLMWKHKKLRKQQVAQAARWADEAGMDVQGYFMMGFPDETLETLQETIDFAKSLPLSSAVFTILTPLPGTDVYHYCKDNGLLIEGKGWDQYDSRMGLVWRHPNLTGDELVRMMKRAYRSFYLRPGIIMRRLRSIKSFKDVMNHVELALQFLK